VTRRHVLPHDGLSHDDAWAAVGVIHGSLRHLLTYGYGDPGFTFALRAFWAAIGGRAERLAYPIFVIGTLLPAAFYLAARRLQYARSICALLAAPMIGLSIAVTDSGHVKSYVIDAVVVLGVIMVIPHLVSTHLRRRTIVMVSIAALTLCTFSVFALIAIVTAVVFAALQSPGRRALRAGTAAVLVIAAGVYLYVVQGTYNDDALHNYWQRIWDGYVEFSANPIRLVANIASHVARTGYVYPGGSVLLASTAAIIAIASIGICAIRGRRVGDRLRARYISLLVLVTLAASIAGKFVFGPKPHGGLRVALWMLPILALGLAIALEQFRHALARRTRALTIFDTAAYVIASLLVLSALQSAPTYAFSGERSATRYIESQLAENDSVIILGSSFGYAAVSHRPYSLLNTPQHIVGFAPKFLDTRIFNLPYGPANREGVTPAQMSVMRNAVHPRTRVVFVYVAGLSALPRILDRYVSSFLAYAGFKVANHRFKSCRVSVWTMRDTPG